MEIELKGEPTRGCTLAWKCRINANVFICLLHWLCFINSFRKEVLFRCEFEGQKKADPRRIWYFLYTCWHCTWHHRQRMLGTEWQHSLLYSCDVLSLIFSKQDGKSSEIYWSVFKKFKLFCCCSIPVDDASLVQFPFKIMTYKIDTEYEIGNTFIMEPTHVRSMIVSVTYISIDFSPTLMCGTILISVKLPSIS